jgi:flagellar basal-body rod protein FlgG
MPNRGNQEPIPEGARVGLGVRTAAIRNLHIQGALTSTGNKLDLAINGRGWFQIEGPNGETLYTRAGSFNKNANGQIVTIDGNFLQPQITIPPETTDIIVNETGEVFVQVAGQTALQSLGQITLANFANDAGLEPLGSNLYKQTTASGTPVTGVPGDPSFGSVHQGYLELSNVDPVKEITELITAQRSYEMSSKVVQAVDEMYSRISRGT